MTQISSPASFFHFNNRLESLVPGGSFDSLGVADLPDRPSADVLITELVQRLLPRFSDRADSKEMQRCIKKLNGLYNKPNITRLFEYLRGVKSTPDPAPKEKVPASSTESDPVKTLPKITERAEKTLPYPSADRLEAILTLLENDNFKGIKRYNFILNCLYLERQLMEYIDWDCERINGILTFKKLAEKNGITPEKDNEFRFIVRLPSKPSKDSIDFALQFRTYILHTKLLETIGPALRYKGSLDRKSLKTTMVILHALLVISKTYNPSTYESISQIELLFTMARIAIYNTLSEEALCQARSSEYYLNYLGQFCNLSSIETVNAISPYARITGELLGIQTTSEHLAVYMGFLSKRYRTFGWKFQSDLYRLVNDRMNKSNDQELITSLRQNWLWNSNQRQLRDSPGPFHEKDLHCLTSTPSKCSM
jgi:hypothetical protein